ncbi:Wat1-related protein [Thalictrum thalictroides]|uniref:WAT1-related protein n=1 Tax=Thalictrum thalictroides TaxID=46969 RepID=A0A7J6WVU6_THATH|nr:Wat1-related protein [Thalictrum thalictroides]
MGAVVELLPCLSMVLVQIGYAGMSIISKLALDSGMNPYVMVTYRQIFATIVIIPFAYFLEWKTRPRITKHILFQIFISSILGATLNQCLYFVGLKYSTPTIASALNNLLPAITFVMALPFGMETVGIKRKSGQAKIIGTALCIGGAMLMSFYKGSLVNIGESSIHWRYAENIRQRNSSNEENTFLGPLLIVGSCVAWAGWFIVQTKMSKAFAAPYTSSALMCFMASIECFIIGAFEEQHIKQWSLASNIRLIASIYSGVIGSALAFCLMSWCIQKRGPLYVSMFSPLMLVIVAVASWALLDEKIYAGTAVGSALIVVGLYAVLWGKNKEIDQLTSIDEMSIEEDMESAYKVEMELPVYSK